MAYPLFARNKKRSIIFIVILILTLSFDLQQQFSTKGLWETVGALENLVQLDQDSISQSSLGSEPSGGTGENVETHRRP